MHIFACMHISFTVHIYDKNISLLHVFCTFERKVEQ